MTLKESRARSKRLGRIRNPATMAADVTKAVSAIFSEGRTFYLKQPINLTVRNRGPYFFIGYPLLEVEGYGHDEEKALQAFAELFSTTWDWYAAEDDSKLTRDARELKHKLQHLVVAVEPAK